MSEQSDAVNRTLREKGVEVISPPPPAAGGVPAKDERVLPTIELLRSGRRLADFAREAGEVCAGASVFRRESVPVTVSAESGMMELLDSERFRSFLEDCALTYVLKYDKSAKAGEDAWKKIPETMDVKDARGCVRADQFLSRLPRLKKINTVRQPVMRADGTIELLASGYDRASEIFTLPNAVPIDESWTFDRAVALLRDLLREFPWQSPRDMAVHVASMVSMFAVNLLGYTSPRLSFIYSSNSPGGGKTLLVCMAVAPVRGSCEILTIPDEKSEFRKILDSAVMSSLPCLFFDELEGVVKNNDLNAFITSDYRLVRLFNKQMLSPVPRITTCYLAGNSLTLQSDIARRSLECKLYVEEGNIRDRKVDREFANEYFQRPQVRGDILSALWAILH